MERKKHDRKIIYLVGFFFYIPIALTSYINSSMLGNYFNPYSVSILYVCASILAIIGVLQMPRILTKIGNRFTALLFSTLFLLSLIVLGLRDEKWIIVLSFILYLVTTHFIIEALDIFIEDFSEGSLIGSIRGAYLSITSLAWVIAQIMSASFIGEGSLKKVYLLSSTFMVLVLLIFSFFLRDFKDPKYNKGSSVLKTVSLFFKDSHISKIYAVNLILKLFYAWMIIYTPIYLHEYMGFDWSKIGIIFSIMLLPFVILDFPLGKLSDKIGEKKMLLIGFVIIILSTMLIPLIKSQSLLMWAFILLLTRVGAATIEIMSESYFFKSIKEEDVNLVSFFRSTMPLSFIIGPAIAIPVLFVVPEFQYIFFALGIILAVGLFISLTLRDVK